MLFQESHEKIKANFGMLEESKKRERHINLLELVFIVFSILIMIPYEMASTYTAMLIFGALNIACDLIFVVLLYRLVVWKKNGTLTPFVAVTDIMAALPGIAEIIVFLLAVFVFRDFHAGEYVAAGGLAIAALKSTKLLRILRVARLFRLIRNIKLVRFLSLRSDSNSCENVVGWLGFMLLVILISMNLLFIMFGPLSIQEDLFYGQVNKFRTGIQEMNSGSVDEVAQKAADSGLQQKLVFIRTGADLRFFNEWTGDTYENLMVRAERRFCHLNSTRVQ
jgi:hypothetical protein